ncbi:UNVERIFIED_CONTAM: hypothetical protein GTU68_020748 [Idotea baltica]|nr:hypothetical protein [Idotea baltica]
MTAYLKINIVLSALKNSLGAQQFPSNLFVMILSLALTYQVMSPTINKSILNAEQINYKELLEKPDGRILEKLKNSLLPFKEFMLKNTNEKEIVVFSEAFKIESKNYPLEVLIPAFLLSELKEAFYISFLIILPFLAIDLIVSNLLAGLGMYMVSPVMISLPLKLIAFVLLDAWLLISTTLINAYEV